MPILARTYPHKEGTSRHHLIDRLFDGRVSSSDLIVESLNLYGERILPGDASRTRSFADKSIRLTVTSPPFLDTINYAQDNWLRCWFNSRQWEETGGCLTVMRSIDAWTASMARVFQELYRITSPDG